MNLKKAIESAFGIVIPPGQTIFSPGVAVQLNERIDRLESTCKSGHLHPTREGRIFCDFLRGRP